ncbi:MAG TPA: dephospho-CoA kinase [Gemmatimonadales bacterium]|nr:dephospho-CoA kinase [Gemmatimonadales bacterium]
MLNAALTGNIASGKSTVAALFAKWGAAVIDADAIVHELQRPGTGVYDAIVRRFGPRVVGARGLLDRATLRARVLADPDARRDLEAIVHPAVARRRAELLEEARRRGVRVAVSDIPLLFEALDPVAFDAVVLVDAPEPERRRRLLTDRDLDPAEVDRLLAAQLPSAAKRARSTWVIDNDGSRADLERRAREVWEALVAAAEARPGAPARPA